MLWPFNSLCWATDCPFLFSLFATVKEPYFLGHSLLLFFCAPAVSHPPSSCNRYHSRFTDTDVFSCTLDVPHAQYTIIQLHSGTGHKTPLLFPWAYVQRASHQQNKLWIQGEIFFFPKARKNVCYQLYGAEKKICSFWL